MPLLYVFFSLIFFSLFSLDDEAVWICSTIIGCTAWIVETIKNTNPKYKSGFYNSLLSVLKVEDNDSKER